MSNTIAVIFDYDDTLVPDSTTLLLKKYGIDDKRFWKTDWKELVKSGYDSTHAYLRLILDSIGEGKPFGKLTNKDLFEFGKSLEAQQYPGLPDLIKDLKTKAEESYQNIEFYVISGGLEEIIRGNEFVRKNFRAIYGCRLAGESAESELKYIKRAITFTEKTRYLFEISKGIPPEYSNSNPMAVNKDIKKDDRKIPFKNMVYIGDGVTDIPCFSLIKNEHCEGMPFGIFHHDRDKSEKLKTFDEILVTNRTLGMYYPEYGEGQQLGEKIRLAVDSWCTRQLANMRP